MPGVERKYNLEKMRADLNKVIDTMEKSGWFFGNVTIRKDGDTIYSGGALRTKEIYDNGEKYSVALTPSNVYLYSDDWALTATWRDIISAATK